MKKRFIFDLDGTLMRGDFSISDQYLLDALGNDAKPVLDNMTMYLDKYERLFYRYDYEDLSRFLAGQTGFKFTPEIIKNWDHLVFEVPSKLEDGVVDTLEDLKSRGKSLAVLTNWFTDSQLDRLKRIGINEYFEALYGGDIVTKPHKEAYYIAAAGRGFDECVFIGDNVDKDYVGPRACGYESILYDKDDIHHKSVVKVKHIGEVRNIK